MDVRFHLDPETDEPDVHRHGVSEEEATYVPRSPIEDRPGIRGARVAVGQTRDGRYLRVIYVPDAARNGLFCITAYDLSPKALHALRRRRRKKP